MCDNKLRCDVCRTINLANQAKGPKPDMAIAEKCTPQIKYCPSHAEARLTPTCIKVCTKEEFKLSKSPKPLIRLPHYVHGKLMYGVKAAILAGATYFTYKQGIWGDQRAVSECVRRWQEYIRSINTRRPPTFDACGNVVRKEGTESILAPAYRIYKEIITTCFSGVVKLPVIVKCMYVEYLAAMKKKEEMDTKERHRKRMHG